jgi:tetratricopeptide (TPR) repeat protein
VGANSHPHEHARRPWGEPRPGFLSRILARIRRLAPAREAADVGGLPELPLALRRGELGAAYLGAERDRDHPRAASAAVEAMEAATHAEDWWPADLWAHRALWHFEQAQDTLAAIRQARRIGDLRAAAGDPASSRRYYAEAIDEARDVGAEHEQGLAALGLGRAMLELGQVTQARRLAAAAIDLLDRAGTPGDDVAAARRLLGTEVPVGEGAEVRH